MSENPFEPQPNTPKQPGKIDAAILTPTMGFLAVVIAALITAIFGYNQFISSQEKAEKDKRSDNFKEYLSKLNNPSISDISADISGIEEIVKRDPSYRDRATDALSSLVRTYAKRDLSKPKKLNKEKRVVRFPEQENLDPNDNQIKKVNENIQRAVSLIADINVSGKESKVNTDLSYTRLQKIDLDDKNIQKISFVHSYLVNAGFQRGLLDGVVLEKAILIGADFRKAHCKSARLSKADLKTANLSGADLTEANVENTNFKSANLTGTILKKVKNLTNSQIKKACYWENAIYDDPDKVKKLKRETSSNPREKLECKRWWGK